ncbi:hypothetical protein K440DRAFT_639407 [Wilcoxina mikolae CBS 423.85]|nr:hypothetical protein K440DRAFT_639407 [Wilcoxina mikolae CBS 423.85]
MFQRGPGHVPMLNSSTHATLSSSTQSPPIPPHRTSDPQRRNDNSNSNNALSVYGQVIATIGVLIAASQNEQNRHRTQLKIIPSYDSASTPDAVPPSSITSIHANTLTTNGGTNSHCNSASPPSSSPKTPELNPDPYMPPVLPLPPLSIVPVSTEGVGCVAGIDTTAVVKMTSTGRESCGKVRVGRK